MFQALRVRDFRLLWAGRLVSALGSWLLVLAVPAHVFMVTGSLSATGLTLAAQFLPLLLLGPVAGVLSDRWDRRRLMLGTNLFRAGAVALMLLGTSPGRYWILYVALVAESCGGVLYGPAALARTPSIVGTGTLLNSASALNALADGAVSMIGGPLGGVLLALYGIKWLICVDVISYLVSAAANLMTSRTNGERAESGITLSAVIRDLVEGAHVLRDQPVARVLLPVTVIFLAANASLDAVLIPFGVERLGGSEQTGLLLSSLGVGYLAGAPVIRILMGRFQPRGLLAATLAATGAGYFLLFTSSTLAAALPAAAAVAMFGSMSLVIPQTTMQRVIPGAALGRVSSVFLTAEAAVTLIGAVVGPFLAQATALAVLAAAASIVTLSAAAMAWFRIPRMPQAKTLAGTRLRWCRSTRFQNVANPVATRNHPLNVATTMPPDGTLRE